MLTSLNSPSPRFQKYFVQHNPVPGKPIRRYLRPSAATPIRKPGIPQLEPTPDLDRFTRNGPRFTLLRNDQPIGDSLYTMNSSATLYGIKVHLRQPLLPKTLTKNEVAGHHLLVATQIFNWYWNDLSISSLTDTDDSPYHQIIRDMNLFSGNNQNQRLPADDFSFNRIVLPVFFGRVHLVAMPLPIPASVHAQGDDPPPVKRLSAPLYPALTS